jgi:hypothetical protein
MPVLWMNGHKVIGVQDLTSANSQAGQIAQEKVGA